MQLNARQRVRDAHLHKAQQGYATYNPPYGYTTVRHNSHSVFKVVPEEAEIVRHIFTSYTRGEGLPRLAKQLGEDGVKPPRRGWWPGTIREILRRGLHSILCPPCFKLAETAGRAKERPTALEGDER